MRSPLSLGALLLLAATIGCPDTSPRGDDGADAHGALTDDGGQLADVDALDAGEGPDAGQGPDAGEGPDAGQGPDAGDGGEPFDASVSVDAGLGDAGPGEADGGAPTDAGAPTDGGAPTDAGAPADSGAADGGSPFAPPPGPYVLLSPPAASQADEHDSLAAQGLFVVEARVGHVDSLRSLGFTVRWDPATLALTHKATVTEWLSSAGGTVVVLSEEVDDAQGSLFVAMGIAGSPVSTAASEPVYRVTFDFAGAPSATTIDLDLSEGGLVQDGASAPLPDVAALDVSVHP